MPADEPFLWITPRVPGNPSRRAEILRVATVARSGATADPRRLREVGDVSEAFLDGHPHGGLVLEGVDRFVLHNGVERVARAVAALHELVATRGAWLLVLVDPKDLNPRLLAWLARELDALPPAEALASLSAA